MDHYCTVRDKYGLISNVTHWMPLPEPPEQDGE
ncbi:DUF551 domain-containing protein [Escherichia coli]|nr:DUF551 domain-containing protein [Escherichia coli]NYQ36828.1 DUF551 domain-containing protein [Escherichia coli]